MSKAMLTMIKVRPAADTSGVYLPSRSAPLDL